MPIPRRVHAESRKQQQKSKCVEVTTRGQPPLKLCHLWNRDV